MGSKRGLMRYTIYQIRECDGENVNRLHCLKGYNPYDLNNIYRYIQRHLVYDHQILWCSNANNCKALYEVREIND